MTSICELGLLQSAVKTRSLKCFGAWFNCREVGVGLFQNVIQSAVFVVQHQHIITLESKQNPGYADTCI